MDEQDNTQENTKEITDGADEAKELAAKIVALIFASSFEETYSVDGRDEEAIARRKALLASLQSLRKEPKE